MTKIVATVAALQQVEQGNLDLDAPVDTYRPEFADLQVLEGFDGDTPKLRPPAGRATVKQLITHTAGFGYWFWNADLVRWESVTGTPNVLAGVNQIFTAPLVADPGTRFEYGINTDWLGKVVEAASGVTLDVADAMVNLLTWARTGTVTPAYPSREQRDADIEAGAGRPAAAIRADVEATSDALTGVVKAMPEAAWSATVRNTQGVAIVATDIPWARAREMWVHAVDLDVGASFADLPLPMVYELLTDVTATLAAKQCGPPVRLVATGRHRVWSIGEGGRAVSVLGPAAELLGWALGRTRSRALRTADGRPLPTLPGWL